MRTDAILINSQGGKEMHKRMDRSKESTETLPGFAMQGNDQPKAASFDEVYKNVAQSNKLANEKTDNSVFTFNESNVSEELLQKLTDLIPQQSNLEKEDWEGIIPEIDEGIENLCIDESILQQLQQMQGIFELPPEQNAVKYGGEYASQATEVIVDAVRKIADTLQINIAPELDKLSLETISKQTIEQFVEIVSTLKSITEALDLSVQQGKPLDTGRAVLDIQSATEVADTLRSELFKIQLGLNMVGIGEEVELESARQLNISSTIGIPQASNPQNLSMPVEQINRIFGDLIETTSHGKETATSPAKVVEINGGQIKEISIGKFDAQTYRTLLKIEKKGEIAEKNSESAESLEHLALSADAEPVMASDISDLQSEAEVLPVLEVSGKGSISSESVTMETRITKALMKTTEENVMSQLTDKVQHMVRSGETEIKIQLKPESLGDVKLAIRMEGDVVAARIQVENQQVKQIVEGNLQSLKDALSEQNLQVGSFEVNVGNGWGRQPDQPSQSWNQKIAYTGDNSNDISEENSAGERMPTGFDTGHRYGNNSVEYYA